MKAKITAAVLAALKRNTFTASLPIHVQVDGRQVTLIGEVDREDLVFEAIATVESVSSALRVKSQLTVNKKIAQPTERIRV
ncbi:MAG: BON domain-containing protein [Anaerolineales bacterium]|nr:BON domain-containing protein [Anaerolineales bacterium]